MVSSRSRRAVKRGYTLVELLIVVAVLGLAGAMVIPQMTGRGHLATQAAVQQLIADLSFAQSDALAQQEMRRVYFYPDGRGYCLIRVDDGNFGAAFNEATADYLADPLSGLDGNAYVRDFTANDNFEGVDIEEVSIDASQVFVTYDELGGTVSSVNVPGSGGFVILRSDESRYRVNIAAFTGKLTVERLD